MNVFTAATIYQYDNPVRLTLEEDGTDVDNDEVLASCMGKTLVVLARNEHWVDRTGVSNLPIQKWVTVGCLKGRQCVFIFYLFVKLLNRCIVYKLNCYLLRKCNLISEFLYNLYTYRQKKEKRDTSMWNSPMDKNQNGIYSSQ